MTKTSEKERLDRSRIARASAKDLEQLLIESSVAAWKITVSSPTAERAVVVPRGALERLAEVLEALGNGNEPSVVPMATELSTGELAELLWRVTTVRSATSRRRTSTCPQSREPSTCRLG